MFTGLSKRLLSAAILVPAVLAAAAWLPPVGGVAILLAVAAITLAEVYLILEKAGLRVYRRLGQVAGAGLILVTWWSCRQPPPAGCHEWPMFALCLGVLAISLRTFPQKNNPQQLQTIGATLLGLLYVPFLWNFLNLLLFGWNDGPWMLLHWGDHHGIRLVIYLLVVVKLTDVGAFFVGCGLGRHKLIPRISPAKSWEGLAGGLATGLAASLVFRWVTGGNLVAVHLTWVHAAILGLLLAAGGVAGDLLESLLKRAAGVKDAGTIIRGMGGLLDVVDSLLLTAPILYIYARLLLGPGP